MPVEECPFFVKYVAGATALQEQLALKRLRPRGIDSSIPGECQLPVLNTSLTQEEWESYVEYLELATAVLGKHSHPQHKLIPVCIQKDQAKRLTCNHW